MSNNTNKLKPVSELIPELAVTRRGLRATQADIAESMGTTGSAIARLESGGGKKKHSPSIRTVTQFAEAMGYEIQFMLVAKARQ